MEQAPLVAEPLWGVAVGSQGGNECRKGLSRDGEFVEEKELWRARKESKLWVQNQPSERQVEEERWALLQGLK